MRKLFWFLVVLAVLAVGADRAADYLAERTVASRVQASQRLQGEPAVDIAGFPFLTQLAQQRFERITTTAADVEVGRGGRAVTLSQVAIAFRDVRANRDFTRFEASTGRARATLPYAELSRVTGLSVSYAGQGRVRARKEFTVAGQSIRPAITVEPRMLDGALTFTDSALDEGLPAPVAQALRDAFDLDVPLDGLPFDIRATSLTADARGVQVRLAGRDLSYRR